MSARPTPHRHAWISTILYNALNIALAVAVLVVVQVSGSPLPALVLVALSKWRVLMVRPRFWLANILSNTVDFIVSVGLVVLLYGASGNFAIQVIMTLAYIAWLLLLKPQSKQVYVIAQAGVAVFVGVTALYMVAYAWPSVVTVLGMWVIGCMAARHVLGSYRSEPHLTFLALVWGLVLAELGWVAYHWTIAYALPGVSGVRIPQVAFLALGMSFVAERLYASYRRHGSVRFADVLLPILLVASLALIMLIGFNQPPFGANL